MVDTAYLYCNKNVVLYEMTMAQILQLISKTIVTKLVF